MSKQGVKMTHIDFATSNTHVTVINLMFMKVLIFMWLNKKIFKMWFSSSANSTTKIKQRLPENLTFQNLLKELNLLQVDKFSNIFCLLKKNLIESF